MSRDLRSQLERLAPLNHEADPAKVRELAERAWHEHDDLLVVRKEWADKSLHTLIDGIGVAVHGKRRRR